MHSKHTLQTAGWPSSDKGLVYLCRPEYKLWRLKFKSMNSKRARLLNDLPQRRHVLPMEELLIVPHRRDSENVRAASGTQKAPCRALKPGVMPLKRQMWL